MPATTRTSTASGQQLRRLVVPNPDDQRELFGDGAPTWTINKGKPGERKSPSADEAKKRHDATVFKLRWHGNHVALSAGHPTRTSLAALALPDKLENLRSTAKSVSERGVFNMHAGATTMVGDGHGARAAAPDPGPQVSTAGVVPGARMRTDPCGLPQDVRH